MTLGEPARTHHTHHKETELKKIQKKINTKNVKLNNATFQKLDQAPRIAQEKDVKERRHSNVTTLPVQMTLSCLAD